jgi:hypothetical protein
MERVMPEVFEKAWGNYVATLEFLTNPDGKDGGFNDQKGLIQLYNFASLVPYSGEAQNYNEFLLMNSVNYAAPGTPYKDTVQHLDKASKLEHVTQLVPQYEHFLRQLDDLIVRALDPSVLPEYRVREQKVDDAQRDRSNHQAYVDGKWADWVANNPNFPPEELPAQRVIWERDNGHSAKLDRLKRNIQFANAQLNAWLRTQISSDLHAILEARTYFDDSGYHVTLPVSANHDDLKKKHLWRSFPMQLPIMDLEEFLENDASSNFSFSTQEEHYRRVETKWKVKAKGRWGIFKGGGSAERRKLEELSTKSSFSCNISFARFEEIDVFRDKWFQPVLFDTLGKQFKEFWGPGGLLATYPVSLFVCRGMKVSVAISDEYKKVLEQFFSGGGSASFGPFFSGGGAYSKDEKYMDFRATAEGFELSDEPKTIRLLGCRVVRPNWSEREAEKYREGITLKDLQPAVAQFAL